MAIQNWVFKVAAPKDVIFEAMIIASFVSLLAKYFLDKRYIFEGSNLITLPTFLRYTFFGGLITMIVFGGEYIIWRLLRDEVFRDIWVFTTLLIGYWVKFQLDLKYTFVKPN